MNFILILILLQNIVCNETSCPKIDGKNERQLSGKMECGYVIKICEFEIEIAIKEVSWSKDQFLCNIELTSELTYHYDIHCFCEGNDTVIMNKTLTYELHEKKQEEEKDNTIAIVISVMVVLVLVIAVVFCWLSYPG